jgi:ABC-type multidrug transport system fused ATPase/permease subunit
MTSKRQTPAEILAGRITDRMLQENLLQPERADNFLSKFVLGKLKEGDWRIEIETSTKPGKFQKNRSLKIMIKLESLTLEALRGATKSFELKFEKNKPICIIFGENGSGKSTVCDAWTFLLTESSGRYRIKAFPLRQGIGIQPIEILLTFGLSLRRQVKLGLRNFSMER